MKNVCANLSLYLFPDNALDKEEPCFSSREVLPPLQTQKRERIKYTSDQLYELESAFAVNQYPSITERDHLAARLGVTESRIQVTPLKILVTSGRQRFDRRFRHRSSWL